MRRWLPWIGLAIFGTALSWQTARYGLPLSQGRAYLWMFLAALAVSLGNLRGGLRGVLEFAPLYLITAGYDILSDHSAGLIPRTHITGQLRLDELLGGGTVPTLELQRHFWSAGSPHWYDYVAWFLYISHFWLPLAVGVVLWRISRWAYRRYALALVATWLAAFVTFWAYPTAPPWLAAEWHYLPPVSRVIPQMWTEVPVRQAQELAVLAEHYANPVAAIPSLHAATPLLICLVLWRYGRTIRIASVAYVLLMGVTLVYTGEHYVTDLLVGWAYAIAAYLATDRLWRRFARRAAPVPAVESSYAAARPPRGVQRNAAR
ncbi:MAG: phosphatase PAP2 family protein [Frankiaceae bacterium]